MIDQIGQGRIIILTVGNPRSNTQTSQKNAQKKSTMDEETKENPNKQTQSNKDLNQLRKLVRDLNTTTKPSQYSLATSLHNIITFFEHA